MYNIKVHFISIGREVRIIIAGFDGIDSVAGMIMHVFNSAGIKFEHKPDFTESDTCVADIVVLNTNSREHYKEFQTSEGYTDHFRIVVDNISAGGTLIYYDSDEALRGIALQSRIDIKKIPYKIHGYFQNKAGFFAVTITRTIPVHFTGDENMKCLSAAREVCLTVGVREDDFYNAIMSFTGTLL